MHAISNIRDDALIRLGLSVGLRVSEVVTITTSAFDFDRQLIKIWDEKKDRWRLLMPTLDSLRSIHLCLNTLPGEPQHLFPVSARTVERIVQIWTGKALGYTISWHALRATYVSRSVELKQSSAVVMANTGESAATILAARRPGWRKCRRS